MSNLGNYSSWEKVVNGVPSTTTKYAGYDVRDDALASVQLGIDLVVAAFHLPHNPYHEPPAELHTQRPPWDTWKYAMAMMQALDKLAGELIEQAIALGYLAVFLADNGTAPQLGGEKGTLHELGINCPLFWVGKGVKRDTSTALVQATDLYATVNQ